MADLLPSTPDTSAVEDADPRVVGVDSEDADELLSALSSSTARELLTELHDEPTNPADLADRVETTLQNAQYHLSSLEEAGLVEVIDTVYSAKGREMNVYAPSDRPLVVFAGEEDRTAGLQTALSRLIGAVGVLAIAAVVVQELVGGDLGRRLGLVPAAPSEKAADETATDTKAELGADTTDVEPTANQTSPEAVTPTGTDSTATETMVPTEPETGPPAEPTTTPSPETTRTATETATAGGIEATAGVAPGLLFFAGGALALVMLAGWYWRGM